MTRRTQGHNTCKIACVAGGIREQASDGTTIFPRGEAASDDSSPILSWLRHSCPRVFTASLPKQKHSRAKSRQLRRLRAKRVATGTKTRFEKEAKGKASTQLPINSYGLQASSSSLNNYHFLKSSKTAVKLVCHSKFFTMSGAYDND